MVNQYMTFFNWPYTFNFLADTFGNDRVLYENFLNSTCFRLLPVSAALPASLDGSVTDNTSDELPFVVAVNIVVAVLAESKSCDAELFWTKGSDWLFDVDAEANSGWWLAIGFGWCWFKRLTDAFRNERLKLADRRRILSRKLRGSSDKINSSDAYIGLWHKG